MKDIYMIGNSHIDPVWFWTWEEGMQEVKATLSSALDRMDEYPEFRFTCSSTAFFEWIEHIDPWLFAKLKARIQEGRMEIVGGWFLEPDCLLPGGEAFVRHALYGQRYLKEKFGIRCHIGFNIDSFGHNAVIPQILRKSGMDTYVFMRPRLPESLFRWVSDDGSAVQALCLPGEYTTWFHDPTVQNIQRTLELTPQWPKMTAFYGVGDHGGGPTKENIESIRRLLHSFPNTELRFATLDDFFRDADTAGQPTLQGPFEKINQGCYSIDAPFKRLYRHAENRLIEADRLMSLVKLTGGGWMDETARMEELWKLLLFNEFHDTFGGTTIRAGRDEAMMQMAAVSAQAGVIRGIALQKLSQRVSTENYGFPLFVFNSSSEPYDGVVEAELEWFCQADLKLMDATGREVPYQRIHTDAKVRHTTLGGRRRFLFEADIPAFGVTVFYVSKDPAALCRNNDFALDNTDARVLDNGIVRAEFDPVTGGLKQLTECATGYQALTGEVHLCLYRDERDCWGGLQGRIYEDRKVHFTLDSMEKIESGALREVIRVRSHFEETHVETHYVLEKGADALRVKSLVRFNHPWHLLKLAVPMADIAATTAETAYGVHHRAWEDDTEYNMQRFLDVCDSRGAGLTIVNDGRYAFNIDCGEVRLTLLRSAIFAQGNSKDWYNTVETYEYTDLGEHRMEFLLRPHQAPAEGAALYGLAERLSAPCQYLLDTVHRNPPAPAYKGGSLVKTDRANVRVMLLKKAEDGEGLILRLLETDGVDTDACLTVGDDRFPVHLGHNSIETYLYENRTLTAVNLLEEPLV